MKKRANPAIKPTIDDLAKYQDKLKAKFGGDTSIAYNNVKFTQLSIARYYGCAKVNGKMFLYNELDDSLIREDVVAFVVKLMKKEAACQPKPKVKRSPAKQDPCSSST